MPPRTRRASAFSSRLVARRRRAADLRRAPALQPRRVGESAAGRRDRDPAQGRPRRALISSSGDDGTQRLYEAAPDLVIPSLRPYRTRGDIGTWVRDDTVAAFLEERLRRSRYAAIGEFHLYGADADLPVPRRMVALAKQAQPLAARALRRRRDRAPLPAVAAGAHPVGALGLRSRPSACATCCASTRTCGATSRSAPSTAPAARCPASGARLFTEFPDRFMVGTDTFTPRALALHRRACRTGRARGSPTCRATWPSASHGKTAKRFSRSGSRPSRNDPRRRAARSRRRAHACGNPGDKRVESARLHARVQDGACADRGKRAFRDRRRGLPAGKARHAAQAVNVDAQHARASPRHELRADGEDSRARPLSRRRPDVPHAGPLGDRVRGRDGGTTERIATAIELQ